MTKLEQFAIQKEIESTNRLIRQCGHPFRYEFNKSEEIATLIVASDGTIVNLFESFSVKMMAELVEMEAEDQDFFVRLTPVNFPQNDFLLGYHGILVPVVPGLFEALEAAKKKYLI